jgi:hypothetical protein
MLRMILKMVVSSFVDTDRGNSTYQISDKAEKACWEQNNPLSGDSHSG